MFPCQDAKVLDDSDAISCKDCYNSCRHLRIIFMLRRACGLCCTHVSPGKGWRWHAVGARTKLMVFYARILVVEYNTFKLVFLPLLTSLLLKRPCKYITNLLHLPICQPWEIHRDIASHRGIGFCQFNFIREFTTEAKICQCPRPTGYSKKDSEG